LFEVILAVAVFALVISGLAHSLVTAIEATNAIQRERAVRAGLLSVLREAKIRPRNEMNLDIADEKLGVRYRTEVEELLLTNFDGERLQGMFVLRATATPAGGGEAVEDRLELYVYRP
jgi:type II secretory pathway component PulK